MLPDRQSQLQDSPGGNGRHSDALREAANTDEGWKATMIAGKAVALSAYDMLTNPAKLKAVQDGFKEARPKRANRIGCEHPARIL